MVKKNPIVSAIFNYRFLSLTPALFVIVILFLGGVLAAFRQSLGYFPQLGENSFTLKYYFEILGDRELQISLLLTIILTAIVTVLSAICGVALALFFRPLVRKSLFVNSLLQIPIALPHLAAASVLIHFISSSGLISRISYSLGLIQTPADFPVLINDGYGIGIILAYLLKETPFVALVVLAILARVDEQFTDVARNLGATAWQRFRFVTLPLIMPSVIFSSLIVFAFVFGAFEVPQILGRPFPAMIAVVANRRFGDTNLAERPSAMAIVIVMFLISMILVWFYLRFTEKTKGAEKPTVF